MENCIFCKIINKQIPSYTLYEDASFIAFLDIRPTNQGHTLIVPKHHYRWVWDIKENYGIIANKVAKAIEQGLHAEFVVSFIIGDEIPHAHIHLVPRWKHDGHRALIQLEKTEPLTSEEMQEIAQKIKSFL